MTKNSAAQDDNVNKVAASGVNLRPYRPDDLNAMVALDDLCFEAPFRFSRASMRGYAEAKHACTIVAEAGGVLAGFCILHVERSRRRTVGYVVTLDVAPEHRRQGLASALMRAVERMALVDECSAVLLHVYRGNTAALSFYERLGFLPLYEENSFYGPGLDALLLRKALL